ncbi:rhomboid family intramembrane serine protease [Acidimangrovimonas sediminis]|uniref:rhomboid family intramembrane serine protease n=1 Tax=Acidimangrovimonas sediminis TaxID=2056283 RepID=UPI000C80AC6E|nr:rhomboid family intramembrane serine protease [Acidimangrovimonas sediminis]
MHHDHNAAPFNPVPWSVWLLLLPIAAMEVVVDLGASGMAGGPDGVGWRLQAIQDFSFFAQLQHAMLSAGQFPFEAMARYVTYPFVHASPTHTIFVAVFLLALGKFVGEVFRPWAVLVVFFASAIVAAVVYGFAAPLFAASPMPLIGGYPADYGLIGAFTFLLWTRLGAQGQSQWGAFSLIGMLMGIQLIFGVFFGAGQDWIADLAGFATGFLISFVLVPGGWQRALNRLRRR